MDAFFQALKTPFDWTLTNTSDTEGFVEHVGGCRLRFTTAYQSRVQFFLDRPSLSWDVPRTVMVPIRPYQRAILQDPEPILVPQAPEILFHLRLPQRTTADFCQKLDRQLGPTAWARMRAIMMAASLEWPRPGGYWGADNQREFVGSYHQGQEYRVEIPKRQELSGVFSDLAVLVFDQTCFVPPKSFALLPTSAHNRLHLLHDTTIWHDDLWILPEWIKRFF